jgi:hypothetical protein
MIANLQSHRNSRRQSVTPKFEELLPSIREQANFAFRLFPIVDREEFVAEVVANAFCAFRRLEQRRKGELAYASPLAQYAIRQVRKGRRVGAKLNVRDITSPYCQAMKGVKIERLDQYDKRSRQWEEIVVEDRRCGPAETAITRLDFATWLRALPPLQRRIAMTLATGETTTAAAIKYGVTPARISQHRRELRESWLSFQTET